MFNFFRLRGVMGKVPTFGPDDPDMIPGGFRDSNL